MRMRYKPRTSRDSLWLNYSALDAMWGVAAPILAFLLREPSSFDPGLWQYSLFYVLLAGIFTVITFGWFRLSHSVAQFFSVVDALSLLKASVAAVLLTTLTCFMVNRLENIPRSIPIVHFVLLAAGNAAGRTFRRVRVHRRSRIKFQRGTENIIIVGASELALLYIQMIEQFSSGTRQIVALLDDSMSMQGRYIHGYPVAGRIREVEQVIDEYNLHGVQVHKIVLMSDPRELSAKDAALVSRVAASKQVSVESLPVTLGLESLAEKREDIVEIDQSATQQLQNRGYWASKRAFDYLVASTAIVVSSPILLVAMLASIVDCGMPFLFWQIRIGRFGNRITVYKFRTLKAPYNSKGERIPEENRLSAIGRLMRKTRLDEFPQLFSVVTGQMSLIGPRPLLPVDLPGRIGLRLAARPGITGWAQVNGATLITIEEKDAMDEWYVRHASWPIDIKIMMLTAKMFVSGVSRNEEAIREALAEKQAMSRAAAPPLRLPAQS